MAELDIAALRAIVDEAITQWAAGASPVNSPGPDTDAIDRLADKAEEPVAPEVPRDTRVVRTKQSGDRVYVLDEKKKTRQWVTNPEVLSKLGFTMADVKDVEDKEFLEYTLGSALYRVADNSAQA